MHEYAASLIDHSKMVYKALPQQVVEFITSCCNDRLTNYMGVMY